MRRHARKHPKWRGKSFPLPGELSKIQKCWSEFYQILRECRQDVRIPYVGPRSLSATAVTSHLVSTIGHFPETISDDDHQPGHGPYWYGTACQLLS